MRRSRPVASLASGAAKESLLSTVRHGQLTAENLSLEVGGASFVSSRVVSPPAVGNAGDCGRQPFTVVTVMLSVVAASYSLVQSLVNPALQPLRAEFHAGLAGIGWVLTAYLLSSAVLTPFLGRVGDHIGRERLLVAATGLLAAGSLVAAVAPDLGVLVVGRVIQGAGGATLPLAFGILRQVLPPDRVGGVVGTVAALVRSGAPWAWWSPGRSCPAWGSGGCSGRRRS